MNNSMISAMVSMNGIQRKLDVIADNIANLDTVGYKQKDTTFEDTLTSVMQQPKDFKQQGRFSPLGYTTGFGVRTGDVFRDLSQGPLEQTNQPMDLAIEGEGMFAVEAGGRRAYTREGAFHFVPDPGVPGSMVLVNNQGYFVLNEKNQHIRVSDKAKVAIDPQGKVLVDRGGAITTAGTLKVLKPLREDELQQMDGNLFVVPARLTENQVFEVLSSRRPAEGYFNPFRVSRTIQRGLHGPNYRYDANAARVSVGGPGHCFQRYDDEPGQ